MNVNEFLAHSLMLLISLLKIDPTVSLNLSQYSILESNNSLTGTVTLSSRASEDVIVEVTISDGSANGNVE